MGVSEQRKKEIAIYPFHLKVLVLSDRVIDCYGFQVNGKAPIKGDSIGTRVVVSEAIGFECSGHFGHVL